MVFILEVASHPCLSLHPTLYTIHMHTSVCQQDTLHPVVLVNCDHEASPLLWVLLSMAPNILHLVVFSSM